MNRYEQVARQIAKKHRVHWRAYKPHRTSTHRTYGNAHPETRFIQTPRPTNALTLLLWLHECGHIVTFRSRRQIERHKLATEVQAWEWAFEAYCAALGTRPPISAGKFITKHLASIWKEEETNG